MTNDYVKKAIEHALALRAGDQEADKKMAAFNEAQNDWYGFCPVCGERLTGTLTLLRGHKHDG